MSNWSLTGPIVPYLWESDEWDTASKALQEELTQEQLAWAKDKAPKCDCGAEAVNTTHSDWCSTNKGEIDGI